jgi:hypothetical protein
MYLFAQVFPIDLNSYSYAQAGFWLAAVGSLVMAVGGGLSIAAIWPASWKTTTGWDLAGSPEGHHPAILTAPTWGAEALLRPAGTRTPRAKLR